MEPTQRYCEISEIIKTVNYVRISIRRRTLLVSAFPSLTFAFLVVFRLLRLLLHMPPSTLFSLFLIGTAYTSVEVTAASINAGTDLNCGSAFR